MLLLNGQAKMIPILWIAAFGHLVYASVAGCPYNMPDTTMVTANNGMCYQFVHEEKSWQDAKDYCRINQGELVNMYDIVTMDYIISFLNKTLPQWYHETMWVNHQNIVWPRRRRIDTFNSRGQPLCTYGPCKFKFMCQYDQMKTSGIINERSMSGTMGEQNQGMSTTTEISSEAINEQTTPETRSEQTTPESIKEQTTLETINEQSTSKTINKQSTSKRINELATSGTINVQKTPQTINRQWITETMHGQNIDVGGFHLNWNLVMIGTIFTGHLLVAIIAIVFLRKKIHIKDTTGNTSQFQELHYMTSNSIHDNQDVHVPEDTLRQKGVADTHAEDDTHSPLAPWQLLPDTYLIDETILKESSAIQKPGITIHQESDTENPCYSGYRPKKGSKETDPSEVAYNDGYELPIIAYEVPHPIQDACLHVDPLRQNAEDNTHLAKGPLQLLPDTYLTDQTISKESSATTRDTMQKPGITIHQESDTENPCYSGYRSKKGSKETDPSEVAYNDGYEVPHHIRDVYLQVDQSVQKTVADKHAADDANSSGAPLLDMYLTCETISKENSATARDILHKPNIILQLERDLQSLCISGDLPKNRSKESDTSEVTYNDRYEVPNSEYEVPDAGPIYEEISEIK